MLERNSRKIQLIEDELNHENFLKTGVQLPVLSIAKLKTSKYFPEVEEVFESLGGREMTIPSNMHYHLQYKELLIQLDDELHFNRYRKTTLESKVYHDHLGFKVLDYKTNCRINEKDCIKAGLAPGFWTNIESEYIFGKSEEPGDLSAERNGGSGWKLRAWRDYLQDISGYILGFKVLRISVYDKIMLKGQIQTFGNLFSTNNRTNFGYATKSIVRRIISLKGS